MAKTNIGLYLGVNSIGAVVVENKKLVASTTIDFSTIEEEIKVENLSFDIRLESLINKALNEISARNREIYLSLSDKDFIFRFLDLPLMNKKEIESSLAYEIKKYIPFKIEEMLWDYSYETFSKEKKVSVSFLGIKESNINTFNNIFSRQDIKIKIFEPSSLSLVRLFKSLKKFNLIKNFAVLDFTENEGFITFYYHDLPLFNRYLTIQKKDNKIDLDKFIGAVRFSLQYFKREFSFYEIEKFVIFSNISCENLISFLKEDFGENIEILSALDLVNNPNATLEIVKAQGVALRDFYAYKFMPILTKKVETAGPIKKVTSVAPLNIAAVITLVVIGLLAIIFVLAYYEQEISVSKFKLNNARLELGVPPELKELTFKEKQDKLKKLEDKLATLKNQVKQQKKISIFLEKIYKSMPEGFWLKSLEIRYSTKYEAILQGYGFLSDSTKESL
ncbi:MAG: pilus assembly protein PilM, partial [Candidatus Omnitrophica bacterium]|nr:pilus assembly protein PilM [Candidatus Omnitrophota bacterium]